MALSKEAQKIKTEYNKKYMERYWERKAEKRKNETKAAAEKSKTVTTKRTTKTVSTVTVKETELFEWLFPEPHVTEVTVSRNGQSDAQYIKALETANKTINTENARLQKLLIKYQDIVRTGIIQWGLMTVLCLWGMVSFMVLAGEEAPEVCMTLGDFFLIKALAITSFSGCILCGKWLSKKGLLPEINIQED